MEPAQSKPKLREISQPLEAYFCSYSGGQVRKIMAASAEHAARLFLKATFTPRGEKTIFVRIYESQDARRAFKYHFSGKGVKKPFKF
jgi:hypothetical protein